MEKSTQMGMSCEQQLLSQHQTAESPETIPSFRYVFTEVDDARAAPHDDGSASR